MWVYHERGKETSKPRGVLPTGNSRLPPLIIILNDVIYRLLNLIWFAVLLQGCENDIDSMVQESSAQIFESLFQLCRHCGELALATETPMQALKDIIEESLSDDEKSPKENVSFIKRSVLA